MLGFAPAVAGGCLSVSFLTTISWVVAKRKQWLLLKHISLFVWVVVISTGLIAVGATLGQSQLYEKVCPTFTKENPKQVINLLQFGSIVLLILSVATPHIYKNKTARVVAPDPNSREIRPNNPLKPLIFL